MYKESIEKIKPELEKVVEFYKGLDKVFGFGKLKVLTPPSDVF